MTRRRRFPRAALSLRPLTETGRAAALAARLPSFLLAALCACALAVPASAQQPFVTDDADVTERGRFELQIGDEYDLLQRAEYPAKTQNVLNAELSYGICKNVEIGFSPPLLWLHSSPVVSPQNVSGIGDSTLHVKYNFLREREGSRRPALALSGVVRFPTGSVSKQLGTGLYNYYINGVAQESISDKTKVRLNGGILFAGNTVNGLLGIRARGRAFTAGASVVKQVTKRLDLGAELTGAVSSNFELSLGQLQTQFGGNYALRKNMTLDFGLVAGRFVASPRVGAQLGVTIGF